MKNQKEIEWAKQILNAIKINLNTWKLIQFFFFIFSVCSHLKQRLPWPHKKRYNNLTIWKETFAALNSEHLMKYYIRCMKKWNSFTFSFVSIPFQSTNKKNAFTKLTLFLGRFLLSFESLLFVELVWSGEAPAKMKKKNVTKSAVFRVRARARARGRQEKIMQRRNLQKPKEIKIVFHHNFI